ncbi:TetR/AcrR family transcriptional regulator [Clostridium thailandense]|uniref:TetR/AcrR family transcriptional regulator n=1 Tax=Clostridium thailandense TaxID=2794346 RepID=UPI00398A44B8
MNTKDRILQTAYDLFLKNGYKNTTTRSIAEVANVNLGLIPYYFRTKENLCIEVYRIMMQRLLNKIDYNEIEFDNTIEQYYFSYLMLQYHILSQESTKRYYFEFLEEASLLSNPSPNTEYYIFKIQQEFNLSVDPTILNLYFRMFIGGERALMAKKRRGELPVSYFTINALLVRAILTQLGISAQIIDQAIEHVNHKVMSLDHDWSLLS